MKRHLLMSRSGQIITKGLGGLGCAASFLIMRVSTAFSEPLRTALYHAVQGAISVVVSFLSVWGFPGSQIATMAKSDTGKTLVPVVASFQTTKPMKATTQEPLHLYTYVFEGQATQGGRPCPLAGVSIRLINSQGTQVKWILTNKEGNYSLPFNVYASHYEPIQWSIEARGEGHSIVKIAGQNIAMSENDRVTLDNSLNLAWLSPSMLHHEDDDLLP